MGEVIRRVIVAGVAGAMLLLAGCGDKETGPDVVATDDAPDMVAPITAATVKPDLAKRDLSFAGTDGDHDGFVSSAEYAASSNYMFKAMDNDDDGLLTVGELDAARTAMKISGDPSSEKLIDRADNDGDRKLTLAEFIADVNARFALVDKDRDGKLTPQEFSEGHPEVPRAFGKPPGGSVPTTASQPG
jgi:Ca2+-binding EF-hand superfamily protein